MTMPAAIAEAASSEDVSAGSAPVRSRRSTPAWSDRLLGAWALLVIAFLFLPIVAIVVASFNSGRLLVAWDGFGLDAYQDALTKPQLLAAVAVSLRTGVLATLLATLLGTLAGVALARQPGRWVPWLTGVLLLVTVTPEIVDAVSLLPWLVTLGQDLHLGIFNDGTVRLVIGHSLFATAVVTFLVRARLAGLDSRLEEASADLYAGPFTTFRRVTLPLAAPAILSGALLAFTLSLDNTIVSSFVQVAGTTSWPVYVLSALRVGLRPEIAAISTLMLLLTLLVLAVVAIVLRRSGTSTNDMVRTLGGGD